MTNKKKALKFIRNIFIAVLIMIALFVSAGLIYTWYVGQTAPVNTVIAPTTTSTSSKTKIRATPSADAKIGAAVQSITSPVAPGENTSIIIKTSVGAWCTISVIYDDVASKDSGLIGKTADEFGVVTWTWTVGPSVPLGSWPVKVACVRNSHSIVAGTDLVVSDKPQSN